MIAHKKICIVLSKCNAVIMDLGIIFLWYTGNLFFLDDGNRYLETDRTLISELVRNLVLGNIIWTR